MKSKASAHWQGGLKDGKGTISADGGAFTDIGYGFAKRFEGAGGPGTTPEELIAAAHASCFSMALANALQQAGHVAKDIQTEALVILEPKDGKPTVTKSQLTTKVSVDGIDDEAFQKLAAETKAACPISRLLNAEVSLEATLNG